MKEENVKKGVLYGIISVFLVGLQPIIANARPIEINAFIFTAMTCLIEAMLFFPLLFIERRNINASKVLNSEEKVSLVDGWKKHKKLILYLGITFSLAMFLFFLGYQLAGAINGSLAIKTSIIFSLFFGVLINHERLTRKQLSFSILLLLGLFLAITQFNFTLLEFNLGVLLLIGTTFIWMLGHSLTRPVLEKKEITSTQLVVFRNAISGIILMITYLIFFPKDGLISLLFSPINMAFYLAIGIAYGLDLYCWYKCLSNLSVSKATILMAPSSIITALFAMVYLGEIFTLFHLIGTIIIIISIIVIMGEKQEKILKD